MQASDPFGALIVELRSLAPRDRRAVLARLAPSERRIIEHRFDSNSSPDAADTADARDGLSPWLAAAVASVRDGASPIAPAAQSALLRATGRPRALGPSPAQPEIGRSLVGALGTLMPGRRLR